MKAVSLALAALWLTGCGSGKGGPGKVGDGGIVPPAPVCDPGGGPAQAATPTLRTSLSGAGQEGWLASPAVLDVDGDGTPEIIAPRDSSLVVWHADGTEVARVDLGGRAWAPPVVGDLVPGRPGLETAVAARDQIFVFDASFTPLPGFPVTWQDELRSIAAGDIDGDGALELVVATTSELQAGGQADLIDAFELDGHEVAGFPPNTSGASGCDQNCFVTGGFDQNLAIGDVDGDGVDDVLASQDNAYESLHDGSGRAFDAAAIFAHRKKFPGIRFMEDYADAKQGFADDEQTANQGHFTNSAPALADVDGDGVAELVILSSMSNAAQDDRQRGVALWVVGKDGQRLPKWQKPFRAPDFLAGLFDFDGTNVVAATNQVAAVDLDPGRAGPEFVFAGFDGRIHAVGCDATELWSYTYTTATDVLTGGVTVADLSNDGVPEIVFTTYSTAVGKAQLVVLDGGGNLEHAVDLPGRGAMAVPTVADVDGDGVPEIVVSLKDEGGAEVLVFAVAGAKGNCLAWPTGRGNFLRSGYLPPKP